MKNYWLDEAKKRLQAESSKSSEVQLERLQEQGIINDRGEVTGQLRRWNAFLAITAVKRVAGTREIAVFRCLKPVFGMPGGATIDVSRDSMVAYLKADLWPQLFSDVSCIALWISSEKILTRLYSVLHWFHKRLEANVKKPRENRCFQTVIVCSFSSFDNSNKCTVLLKIAARLITVSTSVNKEMWVKLSPIRGVSTPPPHLTP